MWSLVTDFPFLLKVNMIRQPAGLNFHRHPQSTDWEDPPQIILGPFISFLGFMQCHSHLTSPHVIINSVFILSPTWSYKDLSQQTRSINSILPVSLSLGMIITLGVCFHLLVINRGLPLLNPLPELILSCAQTTTGNAPPSDRILFDVTLTLQPQLFKLRLTPCQRETNCEMS